MPAIISIRELRHNYSGKTALQGLSLDVETSSIHGLIGPDSAGKTTLMRLLCGLLPIQAGEVLVFGQNLSTAFKQVRARIGYMPQRFSLYQDLSVEENLMFFARLFSVPPAERTLRLPELYAFSRLEQFKTRRAGALSGGMKQKLALSCALIHRPELLILDEPTYGVDPVSRREFWQMLKTIQSGGTSILVSTPYMDEAELCDRVSLIYEGQLLVTETPSAIISNWDKTVYRITNSDIRQVEKQLEQSPEIESCQQFGNELHLVVAKQLTEAAISKLVQAAGLHQIILEPIVPGMEDIYLSYMQASPRQAETHAAT